MAASTTELSQDDERKTRRSLFLGIFIWFGQLVLLNALTSVSCEWHFLTVSVGRITVLQLVEVVISVIALSALAYLIVQAWKNWRRIQRERPLQNPHMLEDTEEDRGALTSFIAMMLNSFFFLFTLATLVPMLTLRGCGAI